MKRLSMALATILAWGFVLMVSPAGCTVDETDWLAADDGFTTCDETTLGCACDPGQVTSCYSQEPSVDSSGNEYCLEGTRTCLADGISGECVFDGSGVRRQPIIGAPELCGGCDSRCFQNHDCPTDVDLTNENADNVRFDLDADGIVLGGTLVSARYAWIANSSEATVSKIDLETAEEVGRYYVCSSPSRTAVDSRGNMYVACRGGTSNNVVKIAGDHSYCVDRNRNGVIETSSGSALVSNDECILWHATATSACPRALAIDARGWVWVGGWCVRNFYVFDPADGHLIRTVPISNSAYGAAIDSTGTLWYSGRSHGRIQSINTVTFAVGSSLYPSCGGDLYGIAVDRSDRVWIVCAHQPNRVARYDPADGSWMNVSGIPYPHTARGVSVDGNGRIWLGTHNYWGWNYGQGIGYSFDADTGGEMRSYTITGCDGAIGASPDFENNIWFACHGSWTGSRLDPDTGAVTNVGVGRYPYTYSDFTGFLRATITAPEGSYTRIYNGDIACGGANISPFWSQLYWDLETPEGTAISFHGRTASTVAGLGMARELTFASLPGDPEPAEIARQFETEGVDNFQQYLEIRVQLESSRRGISPVFRNMDAVYYCICMCDADDLTCTPDCSCDDEC